MSDQSHRGSRLSVIEGGAEAGRRAPHYLALGATLYIPATHPDLLAVLNRDKLPGLRSVVVCTEDAIRETDLPRALNAIARVLERLKASPLLRFIRPRNPAVMAKLLRLADIDRIDGFVLPKVDLDNWPVYADRAAGHPLLSLMPTLETQIAFQRGELDRLLERLLRAANPILCLRIGGNDLLRCLGLKRPKHLTLYDTPLRGVVNDLVLTFRPAGLALSAPVFEHIDSPQTLVRELELDLAHGLLAKTAIHPTQIPLIESAYRVGRQERELAEQIMAPDAPPVFQMNGQMVELATHDRWARELLLRVQVYGNEATGLCDLN